MGQCSYCGGTYHASRAFACPDCIERGLPPRANTKQASDLMTIEPPITKELSLRLAQAVCRDDHLACTWPACGCKITKRKINAVAAVVTDEITGIRDRVKAALTAPTTSKSTGSQAK